MTPVLAAPEKNIKSAVDGNSSLSEALAKGASAPVTRITVLVRKPLLVSEVVFSRLVNKSADQFVTAISGGMALHRSFPCFLRGFIQNLGKTSSGILSVGSGMGMILMIPFYFTDTGNSRY